MGRRRVCCLNPCQAQECLTYGGFMFDLGAVQAALVELGFDAWLFYDFRKSNVLTRRVLGIGDDAVTSRRFFYCVPARGTPRKLVHRIETGVLDHLPGEKVVYLRWQELEAGVATLVGDARRVAMEYVPRNGNPYISRVDAGTVELVRGSGAEVVSSGDLVQLFEAVWTPAMWQSHLDSARHTETAFHRAWEFIAREVRRQGTVRETQVQQVILDHFATHGLVTDHPPIVGVGPNSGDPHYAPSPEHDGVIRAGELVLVDLWAKLDHPDAVYSDYTRMGFVGDATPAKYADIFRIVAAARDAGIDCVRQAFAAGRPLAGWEVDDATRAVIEQAGYGPYFVHRTGHSIGRETHGNGANIDNLETHDTRRLLPRTCFSIEPGIYQREFGVRSEVNVYIDAAGQVHVTGGEPQREIVRILAEF